MEIVAAIVIVAGVILWLALRRPSGRGPALPAPVNRGSDGNISEEQIGEILRSTIKVEISSGPSRPWYDTEYALPVVGEQSYQVALRGIAEAHPRRGRLRDSAECEVTAVLIP